MRHIFVALSVVSLTSLAGAGVGVGSWISAISNDTHFPTSK